MAAAAERDRFPAVGLAAAAFVAVAGPALCASSADAMGALRQGSVLDGSDEFLWLHMPHRTAAATKGLIPCCGCWRRQRSSLWRALRAAQGLLDGSGERLLEGVVAGRLHVFG
jgi:hypothetical protein